MGEPHDPRWPDPGSRSGWRPGGQLHGGQLHGGPPQGWPYSRPPGQGPWRQPLQGQPPDHGPPGYDPFGATQRLDQYPPQPYQGSYGRPAGWDLTGPPQPPPRRSRIPLAVLAVFGVLLMIGGGVAAAVTLKGGNEPAAGGSTGEPGAGDPSGSAGASGSFAVDQCATLTPAGGGRATIRAAECGGLLSDVVVAKIADTECPEPYLSFNPSQGTFYCLAMDAREGDCFRFDDLVKRAVACAGDRTRKVVKVLDGVADGKLCPPAPQTLAIYAYPDPPKTVCLGKPDL